MRWFRRPRTRRSDLPIGAEILLAVVAGCGGTAPLPGTSAEGGSSSSFPAVPGLPANPCGCDDIRGGQVAHQPLSCFCAQPKNAQACSVTPTFDPAGACQQGWEVTRDEGCGKISIGFGGYVGFKSVFDARSGRLIGIFSYSDIEFGPCKTFGYIYGEVLLPHDLRWAAPVDGCEGITSCLVCGDAPAIPRCQ
jgi:hypothetical protein